MILNIILLIAGLALVVFGAEYFVEGASLVAKRFGIPKLIIGLTIVAIGTSTPELAVNIISSISGHNDLALGNILGSNIANVLLIFSISILFVKKIYISKESLNQIALSVIIATLLIVLSYVLNIGGKNISSIEGVFLIVAGLVYWLYLYKLTKGDKERQDTEEIVDNKLEKIKSTGILILIIFISLSALLFGSQIATDSAVFIAKYLGISELVIASTIIAVGTSLPELVTSIHAVKRHHYDLMIGNIVGSNIVNTLFILGASATINQIPVSKEATSYVNFALISVVLLLVGFTFPDRQKFSKWKAFIFLGVYIIFIISTLS